jgi:hypothetical protein
MSTRRLLPQARRAFARHASGKPPWIQAVHREARRSHPAQPAVSLDVMTVKGGLQKAQRLCQLIGLKRDFLLMEKVFKPNRTSLAIMMLVHGYFSATRKSWTLMDQRWMLEHLEKWHHLKVSRSTLCYNLRILRGQGLIDTVTRHQRDPHTGEFTCRVTLYKMTGALRRFFSKLARYFKQCKWIPSVKQLKSGVLPVVGTATSKEEALREYQQLRKDMKLRADPAVSLPAPPDAQRKSAPAPCVKVYSENFQQKKFREDMKKRDDRTKPFDDKKAEFDAYLQQLDAKYA